MIAGNTSRWQPLLGDEFILPIEPHLVASTFGAGDRPLGHDELFQYEIATDPTCIAQDTSLDVSASSVGQNEVPFRNLDPYDLIGKDDLPNITLHELHGGHVSSEVGVYHGAGIDRAEFSLLLTGYQMASDNSTTQISELYQEQIVELEFANQNGQFVPAGYQTYSSFGFEGQYADQSVQFNHLSIAVEREECFQTQMLFGSEDPVLTSYGYHEVLEIVGEAFQNGIADFSFSLQYSIEFEMNAYGHYELFAEVAFEGQINYTNALTRQFQFYDDAHILFRDLESLNFLPFQISLPINWPCFRTVWVRPGMGWRY
ncbi:hypothetical protein [Ruegeria conchae]|uniref:hypothetical protein n=1 Tax=Ruegeria conchae TaxID=981384 RepID=UPI0029C86CAF|nr:hypothetical protein [Ruegeria conchae]